MTRILTPLLVLLFALTASATGGGPSSGVKDDSDWSHSGDIVNVDIVPDSGSPTGWSVTAVDSSGFSNPVPVTVNDRGEGMASGDVVSGAA